MDPMGVESSSSGRGLKVSEDMKRDECMLIASLKEDPEYQNSKVSIPMVFEYREVPPIRYPGMIQYAEKQMKLNSKIRRYFMCEEMDFFIT